MIAGEHIISLAVIYKMDSLDVKTVLLFVRRLLHQQFIFWLYSN